MKARRAPRTPEIAPLVSPDPVTTAWVPIWNMGSGNVPTWSYGTTPPATPADGDRWIFPADATNGVMWEFRYRAASASAYKWEFVGGSEACAAVGASQVPGALGWVDLATVGPSFTIVRPGDYRVEAQATFLLNAATYTNFSIGLFYNGAIQQGSDLYTLAWNAEYKFVRWRFGLGYTGGINAGTMKMQYQASQIASGSPSFSDRALNILPVRVS